MKPSLHVLYIGHTPAYLEQLQQNGSLNIAIAENTITGVNHLVAHPHTDAVFCEYSLPGSNGLYFFNWFRKNPEYNQIPFILLSPQYRSDLYKLAVTQKVDDYYVTSGHAQQQIFERLRFLCDFRKNKMENTETTEADPVFKMPWSKRLFDITVASLILLVLSPILLLIILAIRIESKGKIYYTAKRVGRNAFDFYKLRSMRTGADAMLKDLAKEKNQYKTAAQTTEVNYDLPCPHCSELPEGETCSPVMYIDNHRICDRWYNEQKQEINKKTAAFVKIKDDPRVTRVGKFIRNTSIDELPQLINVIKGDMSLVGNRPLPVYEAEKLTIDTLSKRFLAPAGITGLWQVELRGKGGEMSEEERMRLDNEYADHFLNGKYSFWYDIKLLLRTIPAMFQKSSV